MRSWVFSLIGIISLLGTVRATAVGQDAARSSQGGKATTAAGDPSTSASPAQKPAKELRFHFEWITKTKSTDGKNDSTESESVDLCATEGQSAMTTNQVSNSTSTYRRVLVRPESQADGSYLVSLSVTDFTRDQDRDVPRIETEFRVRPGETKVYQSRHVHSTNYDYDFTYSVTPSVE